VSRLRRDDPEAVRLWLHGLRVSFADFDAAAADMLRPLRKRQLGHETHASMYKAARAQIHMGLDFATAEPEHGDPAGSGGAGAE
jgi:hypothetical protein